MAPGPNSSKEIRVAGTGKVLVAAPVGATGAPAAPIDTTVAWTGWTELGYTSTDGIKLSKKDKIDQVDGWQSVSALRYIYSDRELTVKFQLLQINKSTLPFFMGGGATSLLASPAASGTFKYDLSANPRRTNASSASSSPTATAPVTCRTASSSRAARSPRPRRSR